MAPGRRISAVLALLTLLLVSVVSLGASPAAADRCQPEELIGQPGIIPEAYNPVCLAMDEVVYPILGCPLPTTLMGCAAKFQAAFAADPVAASTGLATRAQGTPGYLQAVVTKLPDTARSLFDFLFPYWDCDNDGIPGGNCGPPPG